MKIQVQFGKPGDMTRILECADQCFGFHTETTSFRVAGAKFYGDAMETSEQHLLATIDGTLAGLVGLCPETMLVNGEELSMIGIGTVCAKPAMRGLGVMQKLLNGSNKVLADRDCDIAFLSGLYERYHHFGYELGGTTFQYQLARKEEQNELILRPLQAADAELKTCLALQQRYPVRVQRRLDEFYGILTQWHHKPYGIWEDDRFLGYVTFHAEDSSVEELELEDFSIVDDVLQALMWQLGVEKLLVQVPGYRMDLRACLAPLGEESIAEPELMLQIRHFEKIIRLFLGLKSQLSDGVLVLDIQERERVKIVVQNGELSVTATEETTDLSLDWADATRLLFSNLAEERIPTDKQAFCKSCFPLDFSLVYGDQF